MAGPFGAEFTTCTGFVRSEKQGRRWSLVGSWSGQVPGAPVHMYVTCKWRPVTWGQRAQVVSGARRFDPIQGDYVIDPMIYRSLMAQTGLVCGSWCEGEKSGSFDNGDITKMDSDVFDSLVSAYEKFMFTDEDPDPGKP